MIKVQGISSQGGRVAVTVGSSSTTKLIQSFPLCTVTVYDTGTTNLVSIFSNAAGTTPKANPFTASSDGSWWFYVLAGRYDLRFSGTGITTPFTLSDVSVSDVSSVIDDPTAGIYSIQEAATGGWFQNGTPAARINRFNDRSLFGAATASDGDTPNTVKDWLETMGGSGAYRLPFSGTVNTSGTAVTWVSGDFFPDYPPGALVGQVIIINSVHYTIASVTNSTHLVLTSSAGVQAAQAYAVGQGVLQGGNSAQVVILNTDNASSNIALLTGAQSRYNTEAVYAGSDIVVNNAAVAVPVWARYIEAHSWNLLDSVSNETTGVEIEVINRSGLSTPVCPNPYTPSTTRLTSALQLGAGGGLDSVGQYDVTMGMLFFKNSMKFKGGILFGEDSIAASGPGGSIPAILFARDQQVQWYRTDGQLCAAMYGGGSTDELHIIASGGLMVGTEGGSSFSGPSTAVDSAQSTRGLNLITTDTQAIDKGGQLGLGGKNGSGGALETFSFATIAGRKKTGTAGDYQGYLQMAWCTTLGQLLEGARLDGGNFVVGTAALATNAANGFLYIPTCAGTPTGTPTTFTGRSPLVIDTSAGKIWGYYGGAWHFVALT